MLFRVCYLPPCLISPAVWHNFFTENALPSIVTSISAVIYLSQLHAFFFLSCRPDSQTLFGVFRHGLKNFWHKNKMLWNPNYSQVHSWPTMHINKLQVKWLEMASLNGCPSVLSFIGIVGMIIPKQPLLLTNLWSAVKNTQNDFQWK